MQGTTKNWVIDGNQLVHANLGHTGGVGNYKFNFYNIPNISNLIGEKTAQFGFRFGSEKFVGALVEN